jgi:hypothetical protein
MVWGSFGKCEVGREKCVCVRGWVSEGGTGPSGCPQPASHLAQGIINPHLPNHCTPGPGGSRVGAAPPSHTRESRQRLSLESSRHGLRPRAAPTQTRCRTECRGQGKGTFPRCAVRCGPAREAIPNHPATPKAQPMP